MTVRASALPHSRFQSVSGVEAIVFGWNAFTLILLYWIENLIIGGINVLKIIVFGTARLAEVARSWIERPRG